MARGSSSKTDEIVAALKAQHDAERVLVTKLAAQWETAHVAIQHAQAAMAAAKRDYVHAVAECASADERRLGGEVHRPPRPHRVRVRQRRQARRAGGGHITGSVVMSRSEWLSRGGEEPFGR